jgi:hypothetical protein
MSRPTVGGQPLSQSSSTAIDSEKLQLTVIVLYYTVKKVSLAGFDGKMITTLTGSSERNKTIYSKIKNYSFCTSGISIAKRDTES